MATHPEEGCGLTGTTGQPRLAEGMQGMKGMLGDRMRNERDAQGQHGGCRGCSRWSGRLRDAGAGLRDRMRGCWGAYLRTGDAEVMTGRLREVRRTERYWRAWGRSGEMREG